MGALEIGRRDETGEVAEVNWTCLDECWLEAFVFWCKRGELGEEEDEDEDGG